MANLTAQALQSGRRNTFSVGLLIALSSWGIIFFTLVWGYVVYRMRAQSWLGGYLGTSTMLLAGLNTLVMAVSSLTLFKAFKNSTQRSVVLVWGTFVLGLFFLVGQFLLWQRMLEGGLHWQGSIAGSFFFLLTGFHALHIVGALVALLVLCLNFNKWQGTLTGLGIKYFWDFLFFVWLVMFILIFIVQ